MKMIKAFKKGTKFPYGIKNKIKTIKRNYEIAETVITEQDACKPRVSINWYDAIEQCNKMTISEMGKNYCVYKINGIKVKKDYSKLGYRLPTNIEWEAVSRYIGYNSNKHTSNIKIDYLFWQLSGYVSGCSFLVANIKESEKYAVFNQNEISDVKTKLPNGLGLYDMSGNVWEWIFNGNNSNRSMLGGSWAFSNVRSEVDSRSSNGPGGKSRDIGYRPVRTLS